MTMSTTNMFDMMKAQLLLNQKDNAITGMILLVVFELMTGVIRDVLKILKNQMTIYFQNKVKDPMLNAVATATSTSKSELYFERDFVTGDNWDSADAILFHVLKIPASTTILIVGQLEIIKNKKCFEIAENISFELMDLRVKEREGLDKVTFRIFSDKLTVCDLKKYVEGLIDVYLTNKKNNLGSKKYFFDQIVNNNTSRDYHLSKLLFSKHLFETNRTLDNVFFEKQEELKNRLDFFMNQKSWYDSRGIPHTLGLLLHGPPGTGKTSCIKAIANMTKRHIINLGNFKEIRTKKRLKKLFYDEKLEYCENTENIHATKDLIIPNNDRIWVLEDFDASSNEFLMKRTDADTTTDISYININGGEKPPLKPGEEECDIDLAAVLNVIDGTLETPGRILIITSNYPEKIDEALIRPGRIDLIINFNKSTRKIISDMYVSFFQQEPDTELLNQIVEYKWSPAEVSQILFKNFNNPVEALRNLIHLEPNNHFN